MSTATFNHPLKPADLPADNRPLDIACECLPSHVAIIMDGNGRWAQSRGRDRTFGHLTGAKAVRRIVTECAKLGLDALTLYSFSTENWMRQSKEVEFLMALCTKYLISERAELCKNNVRFVQIGRRQGLPDSVLEEMDKTIEATAQNSGLTLALALNYGSRTEITDACQKIAAKVKNGEIDIEDISEKTISEHLYTAGLPDPDLLIRTAGEMRLSNYLLWQISYAEFYVEEACWPDFDVAKLHQALLAYARRKRKFGGVE